MSKPSIKFWTELKPSNYVGHDIDIIIKANSKLRDEEIEIVKDCLKVGLDNCDYQYVDEENEK
jgi:hypothetical protein